MLLSAFATINKQVLKLARFVSIAATFHDKYLLKSVLNQFFENFNEINYKRSVLNPSYVASNVYYESFYMCSSLYRLFKQYLTQTLGPLSLMKLGLMLLPQIMVERNLRS